MGLRCGNGQAREPWYAGTNVYGGSMAMNEEDERPVLTPIALDRLGVAELERYIAALRAEIERAEEMSPQNRAIAVRPTICSSFR